MSIAILRIKYFGVSNLPQNYAGNSKQKRMQTGFDKRKNKKDSLEIQSELPKMSLLYQNFSICNFLCSSNRKVRCRNT